MDPVLRFRPSREDWEMYKDTIIQLYIEEKMSVDRLRQYMEEEYGFVAQTKPYRYHFRQWGVKKNLTEESVTGALQQISVPPAVAQRVKTYLKRQKRVVPVYQQRQPTAIASTRTENNLPRQMSMPSDFELPGHCLHQIRQYVQSSSENGLWTRSSDGFLNEDIVPSWCSPVMSAAVIHPEGKGDEATHLLARFLYDSKKQLARQDPLIFMFSYTSVLFFTKTRPDIARFLLGNLYCVAKDLRLNSGSHPLADLFLIMFRMGPTEIHRYAKSILLAYIEAIQNALGGTFPIVQDMMSDVMGRLLTDQLTSCEDVISLGNTVLANAQRQGQHRCKYYPQVQMQVVNAHIKLGQYSEARILANDVERSPFFHDMMRISFNMTMRRINEGEGLWEAAGESSYQAIRESVRLGKQDWVLTTVIDYIKHLKAYGDMITAENETQRRDLLIKQLCDENNKILQNIDVDQLLANDA